MDEISSRFLQELTDTAVTNGQCSLCAGNKIPSAQNTCSSSPLQQAVSIVLAVMLCALTLF
jgi:hypothetical protein